MYERLCWIGTVGAGRLGIMPCPKGGDRLDREVELLRADGVGIVVSLLESAEIWELAVEAEEARCAGAGLAYHRFSIPDDGVPSSPTAFAKLTATLYEALIGGSDVAVHCHHGAGRS